MNRVEVWRGGVVESVHEVSVAAVDAAGRLRARAGDPARIAFARSAVKPVQAMPVVEDGVAARFAFDDRELALCCASHSGEPNHVSAAESMLRKIGVEEDALACGPHAPFHSTSARALIQAGTLPRRVHNNCSGKHAGMLALCRFHDWPVEGYHTAGHPAQQRMLAEIGRWAEVDEETVATAVDGCGVVTFALALEGMAFAFAKLGAACRRGENGPTRLLGAMAAYPEYVGGTGRLCTELARAVQGRIIAKTGAEGVYCATVPGAELGIALKVEDGATRASEPALIHVLSELGVLSADERESLAQFAEPGVKNTRGEVVGRITPRIELHAE